MIQAQLISVHTVWYSLSQVVPRFDFQSQVSDSRPSISSLLAPIALRPSRTMFVAQRPRGTRMKSKKRGDSRRYVFKVFQHGNSAILQSVAVPLQSLAPGQAVARKY
ncbi:hypothetical protein HO173_012603 [Letharia columbiana]|uniref:Uncharacterized protein n=1 Tax=Letharia columbiana TaxID=112416 RepID=A0A8H6CM88_9LECA|nr:uncharacterized protein HO173_012603 [Letharia columbiana]KAF6226013.1 hypothetical protein HO173_012603 [Letharia columbiana]